MTSSFISEWILSSRESLSPTKHTKSWFTPECAAALAHLNSYYLSKGMVYQNTCLIQNYSQPLQESPRTCKENVCTGRAKLKTKILNPAYPGNPKRNSQLRQTVNAFHYKMAMMLSHSHQIRLFAMNFASISTLVNKRHSLPYFSHRMSISFVISLCQLGK